MNEKNSQNTETEIEIRYFKLPFIWRHSKLTQKNVEQFCKKDSAKV